MENPEAETETSLGLYDWHIPFPACTLPKKLGSSRNGCQLQLLWRRCSGNTLQDFGVVRRSIKCSSIYVHALQQLKQLNTQNWPATQNLLLITLPSQI